MVIVAAVLASRIHVKSEAYWLSETSTSYMHAVSQSSITHGGIAKFKFHS